MKTFILFYAKPCPIFFKYQQIFYHAKPNIWNKSLTSFNLGYNTRKLKLIYHIIINRKCSYINKLVFKIRLKNLNHKFD